MTVVVPTDRVLESRLQCRRGRRDSNLHNRSYRKLSPKLWWLFGLAVAGVALWNLPTVFPQRYEYSLYKLPPWLFKLTAVGAVVSAAILWVLVSAQLPVMIAVLAGWMALGYVFYRVRIAYFSKRGVDLEARMQRLHENEQLDAD